MALATSHMAYFKILQIGDLLGTAFLALSFLVLNYAGDEFLEGIESDVSVENVTVVMQGDAF